MLLPFLPGLKYIIIFSCSAWLLIVRTEIIFVIIILCILFSGSFYIFFHSNYSTCRWEHHGTCLACHKIASWIWLKLEIFFLLLLFTQLYFCHIISFIDVWISYYKRILYSLTKHINIFICSYFSQSFFLSMFQWEYFQYTWACAHYSCTMVSKLLNPSNIQLPLNISFSF